MYSAIYTFTAAYGVSFGPIGWVLPSEVFPLSIRVKGVALATASNWFSNCTYNVLSSYEHTDNRSSIVLIGLITPVLMDYSPLYVFLSHVQELSRSISGGTSVLRL
jgi:hypothetical protein